MGTRVATRDHPPSNAVDERLLAAGTVKKVALPAWRHKCLPMLNAMLTHRTSWQPQEVQSEKLYKAPLTIKTVATLLRRCGLRPQVSFSVRCLIKVSGQGPKRVVYKYHIRLEWKYILTATWGSTSAPDIFVPIQRRYAP